MNRVRFDNDRTAEQIEADRIAERAELDRMVVIMKAKHPEWFEDEPYASYIEYIEDLEPLERR